MTFPAYPEYKDSGVEWLGKIPSHWSVTSLYSLASECDFPNKDMLESNLLSLSYGRIIRKDINSNDGLLPESFETYQIVDHGDIVLRLTDLQNDQRSLRSGLVKERGIITSAYTAIRPTASHYSYLAYLLRAYDTLKIFYSMGGGLRQSMKFSDLRRLPILKPAYSEQSAIAVFLDHETAKIDALITEQEKLIELLKEKRQAVISHAVTKGLAPNVPMKDSGVEWLGEVPEHWKVAKLRRFVRAVQTGSTPSASPPNTDIEDGTYWFTPGDFSGPIRLGSSSKKVPPEAIKQGEVKVFPAGAVFVVSIGATLGKIGYLLTLASANQQINAIIPNADVEGLFLAYSLSSKTSEMMNLSNASTIGIMNQEKTKEIWLTVPPLCEQERITKFLDEDCVTSDALVNESQRAIDLLKERRSALISAAVTGKIDVRGFAPVSEAV
ncbi:restriction endonuclease subunit S [Nitratidesulfovibrio vulgaris]|uniref:Restriction modification system DNA specificity domain n=1 Tax=Nitratidesulfovibrio vulgaris (strain DP4) TaxID=391774 RepID=A0A0H3A7P4_NITV4|nr:restriction endonuclease subunit S [Nitratidesulfovibrio vulgaris]ABM27510.1 restriction modification system DNA specificity domain [Nitratidesulfovibrio vulgaris DP4]GEB79574.1 restriction modification system DNA specificity domain-containing protein [Desulfovibrio desulfuricans]